jgi:hypothetical protein
MKATAAVLSKVEEARFHKAVEGMRSGVYDVTITLRSEEEVRGFVKTIWGTVYGCTLTTAGAFCSCPDALYRGNICKHAVMLALSAIRNPVSLQPLSEAESLMTSEHTPNLKLAKVRQDFIFSP